jgi:hypothetical protein
MVPTKDCDNSPGPIRPATCASYFETILLALDRIRLDGDTQGRKVVEKGVVEEYASLMAEGYEFPPVRVWFDGEHYWLADGFQRVAAAKRADLENIKADVFNGSLHDAQWDSYSANAKHGLRRTRLDIENIIRRALNHPFGAFSSNTTLSKHLGVPEATLRRWRNRLSPPGESVSRLVARGSASYTMKTTRIGKSAGMQRNRSKSKVHLLEELSEMKRLATPDARRIINIIVNWMTNGAKGSECLEAIEKLLRGNRLLEQRNGLETRVDS